MSHFVGSYWYQIIAFPGPHVSPQPLLVTCSGERWRKLTIIRREFMMEVMVSLSHRHKRGENMIPRRPAIIKRLLPNPMRERIHTKRRLLDKACADYSSIHKPTPPIAPTQPSNKHGKHPRREQQTLAVILMLPHHDRIAVKITHIRSPLHLWVRVEHHPANMTKQQSAHNRIRILHRIRPPMM